MPRGFRWDHETAVRNNESRREGEFRKLQKNTKNKANLPPRKFARLKGERA